MDDAADLAPRERGWRRLVLAVLAAVLVPALGPIGEVVPVDRMVILIVPALAACAIVGWWRGGRIWTAIAWVGLTGWLALSLYRNGSAFGRLVAGWGVLVAAMFGIVLFVSGARPFLGSGLAAVGLALAASVASFAIGDGTTGQARKVAAAELERRADAAVRIWDAYTAQPEWRKMVAENPDAGDTTDELREWLASLPAAGIVALPALLALQSLAALGLAWALYHRLSRARLGPPLARLREFRFNDQLVWGLVVGITLLVLPAFADVRGAAINLIVFFGALYLLRGFGVLTWFLNPRGLLLVALVLVAPVAWPFFGAAALWFGLGDTWFDWRSRPRTSA